MRVFLHLLAYLIPLGAGQAVEDYDLAIDRQPTVGVRRRVAHVSEETKTTRTLVDGEVVDETSSFLAIRVAGVAESRAFAEDGRLDAYLLEVTSATCRRDADDEEVFIAPGTVVAVTRDGDDGPRYEARGGRLEEGATDTLKEVFSLSTKTVDWGALYGIDRRRRVGESWPIDKNALLAEMADTLTCRPEAIEGTCTLEGRMEVDGHPCLRLVIRITVKDFTYAEGELVDQVDRSSMEVVETWFLSIDEPRRVLRDDRDLTMLLVLTVQPEEGSPATVEVSSHTYRSRLSLPTPTRDGSDPPAADPPPPADP